MLTVMIQIVAGDRLGWKEQLTRFPSSWARFPFSWARQGAEVTSTKYRLLTAFALSVSASYAVAQGTDRRALSAIFDDTHIVDAALPVHRHTASMPAQSRYEHLCRWVLPSADHLSFRLDLEFTPTNPAAVAPHDAHRRDVQRLNRARTSAESRVQLGGHFEVECDITSFDFRDTQLLFAGNWVAPSYDLSSYTFGDLRRPIGRRELSPPMSPVDRWMRH